MRDPSDDEQSLAFRFAHLPLPDEAIECQPWRAHGHRDWRRHFVIREWEIAGTWVSVAGEQDHHGHVTRWMRVGGDDRCSSSDRQLLVTAIAEAGALLDSLNEADPPRSRFGPQRARARSSIRRHGRATRGSATGRHD